MKDKLSMDNPQSSVIGPQSSALGDLLLALADDEFITGYANSEWTGIAPVLEEDIAFSSLAQDELGHAKLFYELLSELQNADFGLRIDSASNLQSEIQNLKSADAIAYGRLPSGFCNAQLVERPRGDWAYSVTRQFLYDTADYVRLDSLCGSSYAPLAAVAQRIIREEKYHLLHAQTWLERLAGGGADVRERQQAAFEALWPDALGVFEPVVGEDELVAAAILPASFAELRDRWLASIAPALRRLELPFPFEERDEGWQTQVAARYGGRRGEHSADFAELYETITSVYRIDPNAKW
jgi:ring-1,2-phenylacetyl-CoA epoxidase subunit PaaC